MARLHRGIDALRQAKNQDKAPYLDELRSLKCKTKPFCELKELCTRAYAEHLEALAGVDAISAEKPRSATAPARLEAAKKQLVEAKTLAQSCVARQAELRDPRPAR